MRSPLALLVLLAACSSGSGGGTGGGTAAAGGQGGSGGSAGGAAGGAAGGTAGGAVVHRCEGDTACNALVPDGGTISPIESDAGMPAALGGMVANGAYNLTALNVYGSGAPPSQQVTLTVSGPVLNSVSVGSSSDGGCLYVRTTGTVVTDGGTELTLQHTCPPGAPAVAPYSASPTTFKLYVGNVEQVFTQTP